MAKEEEYKLSNNIKEVVTQYFAEAKKENNFANARCARNLFEKIKFEQANRVAKEMEKESKVLNSNNSNKSTSVNLIKKCDAVNVIQKLESSNNKVSKIQIGFAS